MNWFKAICLGALLPVSAAAHWDGGRPDGHAPISIMGDHTHSRGEWMLAYRYMSMKMEGWRSGSESLSREEALAEIPGNGMGMKMLPQEMTMTMHMVGAMYATSDDLTLTLMLPYVTKEMEGTRYSMSGTAQTEQETAGMGDVGMAALWTIYRGEGLKVHLNLGLGLPTGSINETGWSDMAGARVQLPYGMQLGSGTFEARPGITLFRQYSRWSWGAQAGARIALDNNSLGYRPGSRRFVNVWAGRNLSDWSSASLSIKQQWWSEIHGDDRLLTMDPDVNPGADPDNRGGRRTDVGLGVNLYGRNGALKGHRLALEYLVPVAQSLNGLQLEADGALVAGWQKAW